MIYFIYTLLIFFSNFKQFVHNYDYKIDIYHHGLKSHYIYKLALRIQRIKNRRDKNSPNHSQSRKKKRRNRISNGLECSKK